MQREEAKDAKLRDVTVSSRKRWNGRPPPSEILRVIASSPTDIQPVLDTIAANAARLCDAKDTVIYRVDGDVLQRVAKCGPIPMRADPLLINRGTVTGRAVVDCQTVHIHDIEAESETDYPNIDRTGSQDVMSGLTEIWKPATIEQSAQTKK